MRTRVVFVALMLGACAHPTANAPRGTAKAPSPVEPASAPSATPAPAAPAPAEPAAAPATSTALTAVDFTRDVRPILESRCQPCHFPGGRMYGRLPFDRPETIQQLGEKLFTRIKDEPSQATIRKFLAQGR